DLQLLLAVDTLPGPALARRQGRELGPPVAQHVRLDAERLAGIPDLVIQPLLHLDLSHHVALLALLAWAAGVLGLGDRDLVLELARRAEAQPLVRLDEDLLAAHRIDSHPARPGGDLERPEVLDP